MLLRLSLSYLAHVFYLVLETFYDCHNGRDKGGKGRAWERSGANDLLLSLNDNKLKKELLSDKKLDIIRRPRLSCVTSRCSLRE